MTRNINFVDLPPPKRCFSCFYSLLLSKNILFYKDSRGFLIFIFFQKGVFPSSDIPQNKKQLDRILFSGYENITPMKKLTDDQLARMRNVDYQRMLRREARKKRKAKEARAKLKWYDDHPDHPKTIAFRQAAMDAAEAKHAIASYNADKRAERLEKRLNVSMENFIACFKLDHNHPAGISPANRLARVESVVGNAGPRHPEWKAYAMGKGMMAQYVVNRLRNTPETPQERRNVIPAALKRAKFMIQRKHSQNRVEGVVWKSCGIFETAGGYVAACRLDTGEVFESSQTYAAMIRKLERRRK